MRPCACGSRTALRAGRPVRLRGYDGVSRVLRHAHSAARAHAVRSRWRGAASGARVAAGTRRAARACRWRVTQRAPTGAACAALLRSAGGAQCRVRTCELRLPSAPLQARYKPCHAGECMRCHAQAQPGQAASAHLFRGQALPGQATRCRPCSVRSAHVQARAPLGQAARRRRGLSSSRASSWRSSAGCATSCATSASSAPS